MKTILIATDFTKAGRKAMNYAAEMAAKSNSKLVLFHVCHPPVMVPEAYAIMPTIEILIKESLGRLKRNASLLRSRFGSKLDVECICKCGFAADELDIYAKNNHVDLVVMGMHESGRISERIFGSTTTAFMKKTHCPVLSVSATVKYRRIKRMVLASDYNEYGPLVVRSLKEFAVMWGAHVHILHVFPEGKEIPSLKQAAAGLQLEKIFKDMKHTFQAIVNNDVVQGINDYVAANKIDLVVMIPSRHNFFDSLIRERTTKKMAFHSQVPLLTIH